MAKARQQQPEVKETDVTAIKKLNDLNEYLQGLGLLPILVVDPADCIAAEVNARYFMPETFQALVDNVKNDGRLESVPLVWKDPTLPEGKYRIVSGHHRIDAAKAAGISSIMVMIASDQDYDTIISKQLAHNALVGVDDATILKQLFDSIEDIGKRFATGLSDSINKIQYPTINFKVGTFKEFTVLFVPEEIEEFDKVISELKTKAGGEVRVSPLDDHKEFISAMMRIKKTENIKSNGVALSRLVQLALSKLNEQLDV